MTTVQESNLEMSAALSVVPNVPNVPNVTAAAEPAAISSKRRVLRAFQDGLRFGKYQIVHLIAIGGMSEVYEAVHLGLEKRVALKVMRPDLAENAEARRRFVSEGIHAARIRHTNVVDVSDVGLIDELPYLVMELLVGEDLGMLYERQKRVSVADLVDLLLPVAFAVSEGHAKGVIHRDLKPENIFLHREGRSVIPKVLDFGVSRVLSARRITLNASVFGTPHYMAPEQARGDTTDERTDQYSLGVMLYEGVTGRLPRDSSNPLQLLHSVAYETFEPPSVHVELPTEFEAVILRAMAPEPDQRFVNMHDLGVSLLPFASETARKSWERELGMGFDDQSGEVSLPVATRYASSPEILRNSPAPLTPGGQVERRSSPERRERLRSSRPDIDVTRLPAPQPQVIPQVLTEEPKSTPVLAAVPAPAPLPQPKSLMSKVSVRWVALAALAITGGLLYLRSWTGLPAAIPVLTQPAQRVISGQPYFDFDVQVTPASAELTLDGRRVGDANYHGRLPRDGSLHVLHAEAAGHAGQDVHFQDAAPPSQITLVPLLPLSLSAAKPDSSAPLRNDKPALSPALDAPRVQPTVAPSAAPEPEENLTLPPIPAPRPALSARPRRDFAPRATTKSAPSITRIPERVKTPVVAPIDEALSDNFAVVPEPAASRERDMDVSQAGAGEHTFAERDRNAHEVRRPRVRVIDAVSPRVRLVD